MHARLTADDGKVVDVHVTGEGHVVGDDDVVAHHAVVGHMHVGHEQVTAADARDALILHRPGRESAVFAHDVVVADFKVRLFALVLFVLRFAPHGSALEEAVAATDRGQSLDDHVAFQDGPGADAHVRPHHAERTDLDVVVKLGSDIDDAGMMDFGHDDPFVGLREPESVCGVCARGAQRFRSFFNHE